MIQDNMAVMKHSIQRVGLLISLMLMATMQTWAGGTITKNDIIIEVLPANSGNTVSVIENGIETLSDGKTTRVTIAVAPTGSSYTINESLIMVVPMVKPSALQQAPRRAPGFAGSLPVHATGTANQYYFDIPDDYDGAYVTATFVESSSTTIYSLSEITTANGNYKLAADISGGEVAAAAKTFSGTLDGDGHKIYNLNTPIFNSLSGTVKNVMLEDVNISSGSTSVTVGTESKTATGAIACEANGSARIYNCGILSGGVSVSSNIVGGLVGLLDGSARVINCFSYADVAGGTDVAGIVGYNNYASKSGDIRTMVMNCMFYGNITSGTNISPVYGGLNINNLLEGTKDAISNTGLNTFNYYRYESPYSKNGNITAGKYNCALAVEEEFLTRIEIYRQLLNSNRKLAAWYVFGSTDDANTKMAKWVLETADGSITDPKPYPVLKKQDVYPSIVNYDATHAPATPETTLTINISGTGVTTYQITRPITDKDPEHFNYNYHKVQLPYFNEVGTGNYTNGKVVTGWEVSFTGSTSFGTASYDFPNYNLADRKAVNGRIYSQGAYLDVPEGVSTITLTPHWATNVVFVSDANLDKVYSQKYCIGEEGKLATPADVTYQQFGTDGTATTINGINMTVYTNITTAINQLPESSSVYDNAVVLVGNVHLTVTPSSNSKKSFTVMSADFDQDHEPDYSLIYTHSARSAGAVSPIRFDFLNMPGFAMAQKPNGSSLLRMVSIFKPTGWFEVTNTCLLHMVQFECDNGGKSQTSEKPAPVILLGGKYDQFVSTQSSTPYTKTGSTITPNTTYIYVGGNAWFELFGNGTHSDGWQFTPHVPISISGGCFDKFYLSGTYRPDAKVEEDNAECYISGGKFGELAGAGQQQIDGDVNWFIDYADIDEFYGGGINAGKPITGNINTVINKSNVKFFCGGPKFGDMQKKGSTTITWSLNKVGTSTASRVKQIAADRTVTTKATGCTFGNYYGAGYGGNSYYRLRPYDKSGSNINWPNWQKDYTGNIGKYIKDNNGVATDFDYEYFIGSDGTVFGRFYVQYASFSMAQTNNVASTLDNCTITGNFYGGGCRGKVDGKAESTLKDCTVTGNVFGGGYSASVPTIDVRSAGFTTIPTFNKEAGVFNDGVFSSASPYTWTKGTLTDGSSALSDTKITTDADLSSLGQVKETDLKIQGDTRISGLIDGNPTGGAFGGGDASAVYEDTKVTISAIDDNKPTIPNVFGGGNLANVLGNATVDMQNGVVSQNIYGGGNNADVTTNTTITMSDGTVNGNVYGGGNLGCVGAFTSAINNETQSKDYTWTNGGTCNVTISGGKIGPDNNTDTKKGNVFGAGKGVADTYECEPAMVYKTNVIITNGIVNGSVYGGGEVGRVENNTLVTIGSEGESASGNKPDIKGNVFGAGAGVATHGYSALVRGNSSVTICGIAKVNGSVYGGGETASVGRFKVVSSLPKEPYSGGTCTVTVNGNAKITGDVFGACKGVTPDYANNEGHWTDDNTSHPFNNANEYYAFLKTMALTSNTNVTIGGSAIVSGRVFGGGQRGVTLGGVKVDMTGGTVAQDVYGGGALADTNTANWDGTTLTAKYFEVTGLTVGTSDVTGLFTKDGTTYTAATGTAQSGTKYYRLTNTIVSLTGGKIVGAAYGGGLGDANTAAYVWGDVLVDLNGTTTMNTTTGKPTTDGTSIANDAKGCVVNQVFGCNNIKGTPKGDVMVHVFATQNAAKDAITGTVAQESEETDKAYLKRLIDIAKPGETVVDGVDATVIASAQTAHDSGTDAEITAAITAVTSELGKMYDVQAVYGGGNNAAYVPVTAYTESTATGSKAQVVIEGCDFTSIQYVYGGGNAAPVPDTYVLVKGTKIIDYVFGGGNGTVSAADVGYDGNGNNQGDGNANTTLMAGTIHNVYGASNTNGDIRGKANITKVDNPTGASGCCDKLVVNKMYSAGKDADISGGSKVILGCMEDDWIEEYYGGAENANVLGDVELTITSGKFRKVFGGNKTSGAIFGHIKVNIEETGCIPIYIDELYGCGNMAPYSIYGYYKTGVNPTNNKNIYAPRTSDDDENAALKPDGSAYTNTGTDKFENYDSPEVNIISATRIGQVFGGGLGSNAIVYGNPTVNINQITSLTDDGNGTYTAGTTLGTIGANYQDANSVAVTGGIFGGGNEASVHGNTTVNIGTVTSVTLTSGPKTAYNVLGANITSNVYGGGNKADVIGDTKVIICAEETGTTTKTWTSVDEGAKKVTITGNVFGAGKGVDTDYQAALVKGNSNVYMGNGIVKRNIYGGGELSSVGNFTYKTGSDVNANNMVSDCATGTGKATVNIFGGTVGDATSTEYNYDATKPQNTTIGNVFAGSKGQLYQTNSTTAFVADWYKFAKVKETVLKVSGANTKILSNVYGGGELGTVGYMNSSTPVGGTSVTISNGIIGTEIKDGGTTQYTIGSVFGGGYGSAVETTITTGDDRTDTNAPKLYAGKIFGSTSVTMEDGTVKASVYGGGQLASVGGNAGVTVSGGTIGIDKITSGTSTIYFGGSTMGNVYGGGSGNKNIVRAGQIFGNTTVNISQAANKTTRIYHNIYGGGAYGSVGTYQYHTTTPTTGPYAGIEKVDGITSCTANTGTATVTVTGGTIGVDGKENGMIFGSSRGDVGAPGAIHDKLAWVYDANVTIGTQSNEPSMTNPSIAGSVYGSGENGHTFHDATVTIHSGKIGITDTNVDGGAAYEYRGNVYGSGCGTDKYTDTNDNNKEKYNPLAGIVQGNTTVNISGGHVVRNVYGAGAMGSVGTASDATSGKTTITVTGGRIGYDGTNNEGNIFGAARGDLAATGDLALVRETEVNISYATTPTADNEDKNVQLIAGSVFGGGEAGTVKESVAVNMTGGLVLKDVYGGGALADTQTSNWDATANDNAGGWADADKKSALHTTTVRLTGGTILGEAYGGALGEKTGVNGATNDKEAFVYGDVLLDLNGTTPIDNTTHKPSTTGTPTASASGCVVDQIFGCNNVNGSPKGDVMVHIYATQNKLKTTIADKFKLEKDIDLNKGQSEENAAYIARLKGILTDRIALAEALNITVSQANKDLCTAENPAVTDLTTAITGIVTSINAKSSDAINGVRYDVEAVYGGGNMAAYVPATPYNGTTGSKTQVFIEGCSKTSIETVYGGGNAAAVPETNVEIREAYEILAVFGGGNGKDKILINNVLTDNPGADIGQYKNGTETVIYGTGDANSTLKGGYIHEAYGGSNTKGVVKGNLNQTSNPGTTCTLIVDKIVGAGKYADIDGDVIMTLSCQPSSKVPLLFAGADEANVNGNITLNITNGNFGKVFGGNNLGGVIKGKITVNVEETGCQPIKIDELYLGGNEAAYSIYGYYESNETHPVTGLKILKPRTAEMHAITDPTAAGYKAPVANPTADATHTFPYAQPELNIISCTYIGKVFGGGLGSPAKMYANPTVNVNMVPSSLYADGIPTFMNSLGLDDTKTAPNPTKIGIIGDVFGGGNAADIVGNTTVNIAVEYVVKQVNEGANVTGYYTRSGAGTTADPFVYTAATGTAVEGKTYYEKKANQGSAYIIGSIFGGGNAADVLGNTNVTMSDGYVFNGIFGGGYAGSVGTFTRSTAAADVNIYGHTSHTGCIGKPVSCAEGTGKCTVVVNGGQIGPLSVATQGMNRKDEDGKGIPVPEGWVWGAGQGLVEDPATHPDTHFTSYVGSTDVTIGGTALIMESIIGGGEFGRVLGNTLVKIEGGQIGIGANQTETVAGVLQPKRYTDDKFVNPLTTTVTDANALAECSHYSYGKDTDSDGKPDTFLPYDPYYDDNKTYADAHNLGPASTSNPCDGKTWIGCVFGGGSGYMPYLKKDNNGNPVGYEWVRSAGWVEGNSEVRISGGHILTNVYGGNEVTDVKGKSIVKMTGGTIGVPRTLEQIAAHPLSCYLFGAGKGDDRSHFYDYTNTGSVEVDISGGIIYGSVFGGSEDGHVTGDIDLTIRKGDSFTIGSTTYTNGPVIGTWGTSYVDGNVFGAGRGFSGNTLTAGNVGGNVTLNITGGNILGSVYGGGRLASVGTYLVPSTDDNYGKMIADNDNATHGHVTIDISGGTIGNRYEYAYYAPNTTIDKTANHIPYTEFDATTNRLTHTKGGNVFTGAMGRLYALNGTTVLPRWLDMGKVKSTKLTVSGSAVIKSSIYGGGELGWTTGTHKTSDNKDVSTEISITGGTIGSEIQDNNNVVQYTYGSVFGGGYGNATEMLTDANSNKTYPTFQAGRVMNSTAVTMSGGTVKASVYGGGELANVGYGFYSYSQDGLGETAITQASDAANTYVTVSGGTIGRTPTIATYYGGATMGNVYGGGSGNKTISRCGLVLGNTNVNISGEATRIYHNIYGGGAYGSVGDYEYTTGTTDPNYPNIVKVFGINGLHTSGTGTANVTITGGTIGYDGKDNGMVFGSSRGDVQGEDSRDDYMAWVNDAIVTIGTSSSTTGPHIRGSVYGSGENGHVFHDTDVKIYNGTIGIDNADTSVEGYTVTSGGTTYNGPEYPSRGNVYGGGCGTDTYTKNNKEYFNPTAGIVKGNTNVTMTGGHVVRAVYGGGSMGSVGTFTNDENGKPISCVEAAEAVPATDTTPAVPAVEGTGLCTVTISGGKIGPTTMAMPNYYGNVFGAGRGEVHDPADYPNLETSAYFNRTAVTINGTAFVKGSVYGGAESGHVLNDTHVVIDGNSQIGCGKNTTNRYEDDVWTSNYVPTDAVDLECVSWPFAAPYAPYDKFAKTTGYYDDNQTQSADNARPTGSDGHTFYGNVFGGGSGSTPYAAGKWLPTAGWVEGNTTVEINGGHILTSVYGGNEMSDVGAGGVKKMTDLSNPTPDMFYDITKSGGKCTVKMIGGTIGVPRTLAQIAAHPLTCYLFGAGKGDQRIFFNKTTNVKEVEVEVSGGKIYGSVFGGGEDGHVMKDVKMTIKDNANIGTWGTSYVDGNVFGGGRGFSGEALTAGNVGGSVQIDITGGSILGSVYGGGRLGSVGYGLYLVDETVGDKKPYGVMRDDNVDDRGNEVVGFKRGYITINISGGTIGNNNEYIYNPTAAQKDAIPNTTFDSENHLQYTKGGNVFTGGMGRLYALDNSTLLTLWPKLGKCKQTTLNMTGGTVKSSIYGGGEIGAVAENATVNVNGGTVGTKIVDPEDATKYYYFGSVFGGGKGSTANVEGISEAGTTGGNVQLNLNETHKENGDAKGAIVHQVFGCNDMNGSPKGNVTVHVYATQNADKDNISTKYDKNTEKFDVEAVYGGGNLAAYEPTSSTGSTNVIIDGCGLTSIRQVYGGGNAASTPATNVEVNGTYEILELFGGGNGFDKLPDGRPNPGANVGYKNYTVYEKVNKEWVAKDDPNYDTKEERTASTSAIVYGSGRASLNVYGGTIHRVFGGSNTKGNVRQTAVTLLEESGGCPFCVDEAYGGGKSAEMDAEAKLLMACIPGLQAAYGGAEEADVHGNVTLNITNGTFDRVFGGNNLSGTISGAITVNIEEIGCRPIKIGELYGGGNQAGYSVYGYDSDGKPIESGSDALYDDPKVNVKSFTSIGKVFGGGYGSGATMVGNPTVNVNEVYGKYYNDDSSVVNEGAETPNHYPIPSHEKGKMGAISEVFGGGNAAKVIGNTTVNIATAAEVYIVKEVTAGANLPAGCYTRSGEGTTASPFVYTTATGTASADVTYYEKQDVLGVDIRGNVYGGGNNAEVTGNTNVNIGKEKVETTAP